MDLATKLIPENDDDRLQALSRYQQLSPLAEPFFDELVRLTARLFGAPIALVSLVEKNSVYFPGNVGLDGAERVSRSTSLCSVAILRAETTVFENLNEEPCSLTDPFLVRALNLQFYAGRALRTADGFALGSLCVIDRRPRQFSAEEDALLASLTSVVMQVLDLRKTMAEDPAMAPALWDAIHARIDTSLRRLSTWAELGEWEETPDTPAAHAYRVFQFEEAARIVEALHDEIEHALTRLTKAPYVR